MTAALQWLWLATVLVLTNAGTMVWTPLQDGTMCNDGSPAGVITRLFCKGTALK